MARLKLLPAEYCRRESNRLAVNPPSPITGNYYNSRILCRVIMHHIDFGINAFLDDTWQKKPLLVKIVLE